MNALQISPAWKVYYDFPTGAQLGAVNAMMPAGKVVSSLAAAPISNRFGRKKTLVIGFVLAIAGAVIQTASVNYPLLLLSRLVLGLGSGFMSQPSPILLAELAYPTHRGKITSLYNTLFVSLL
jgi:MFS family permease